ncbi:MAG: helix-turn-helix transcriptional regulator [Candidatus Cloacimonetes bacterium]|jgi:transcriptional regulator with XRE-family HTH domain|nr:helix-turn-helix domain-containing protein [Candidatus Cloacimonadota bacterium]MDY0337130.1 helix-turn-helix transcriptional regulator [Candidatus Cloacimonadaceae bacterium]MDD2544117.1 helix-turn-helix transcriptional regulator [Candidatus Cloacimonadota bacterium]MDD2682990.1 helix-turn-helix transcriptional regulator [Candidatus Cloacimonadota bacterium]MDD3096854.1 helix-turn-helix transcriptional regulator [Candidatus Cloacimonadota bacterium]
MASKNKLWTHKHNESAQELNIDFSSIPKWKRDLIDIVADLSVKRIKLRMTQDELAKKMGVKQPVVARFEYMGRTPGLESIYKYAEGLGLELKPLKIVPPIPTTHSEDDELELPKPDIAQWQQNVYELIADLKVSRLQQRVSQAELARRMGTSQSVITRFERMGRIPTIEFIYKVADALGVELEGLSIREYPHYSCSFEDTSYFDSMVAQAEELSSFTQEDYPQTIELRLSKVSFPKELCVDFSAHPAESDSIDPSVVLSDMGLHAA